MAEKWEPSPIDGVIDEYGMQAIIDRARAEERWCCDAGCGSGACEVCPCCSAGWCIGGADGLPDDMPYEDKMRWLEIAEEHNPAVKMALAFQSMR